jgi:hypothetical protein
MLANSFFAKVLRFFGIVLMGLTAGFTLLGGAGTSCVALNPTGFGENMAPLAPFQWLYILFVLTGVALGILGIRATLMLIKGRDKSYRDTMIVLIAGVVIGAIHMAVSQALRGKSMPVDAVVYTTIITLAVFLLLRIPTIWQGVNFTKGNRNDSNLAGRAAAIVFGLLTLTIQFSMGPTHTWNGVNYADAFNVMMGLVGVASLLAGASQFFPVFSHRRRTQLPVSPSRETISQQIRTI